MENNSNIKSNIDLNDEFFQIKEVQEQIKSKNLTYINTIFGDRNKIGNALMTLNNLINICENIKCKNIIIPSALTPIIKNPIIYKEYNINIFPYSYKNKIKIDIQLNTDTIFQFRYRKKTHNIELQVMKNELLNNIPKYKGNPNDLIIKIRSGDIFIDHMEPNYSQPPLCFYQKIINNSKFNDIIILSNGHENPVVDELIKLYPKIKYLEGTIELAIAIIVNAFNFVMPMSTFPRYLLWLNSNLRNLYVYEIGFYHYKKSNNTMHIMKPSQKYLQIMNHKWNNTKEQLNLMLKENCINSKMTSYSMS